MKNFNGEVLFLDRANINTDEIIPAKYLTEIEKKALKEHLLEDLKTDNFDCKKDIENKNIIITKENFGCGSSREHAVWALEENNINAVIGISFARIFKQNMFNCGMLAIELPIKSINFIFENFNNSKKAYVETNFAEEKIIIKQDDKKEEFNFNLSSFNKDLILQGGWLNYANLKY